MSVEYRLKMNFLSVFSRIWLQLRWDCI